MGEQHLTMPGHSSGLVGFVMRILRDRDSVGIQITAWAGFVRVDNVPYSFMGDPGIEPKFTKATQLSAKVPFSDASNICFLPFPVHRDTNGIRYVSRCR